MEHDIIEALGTVAREVGLLALSVIIVFLLGWMVIKPIVMRWLDYRQTTATNKLNNEAKRLEFEEKRASTDAAILEQISNIVTQQAALSLVMQNFGQGITGVGNTLQEMTMTLPTKGDLHEIASKTDAAIEEIRLVKSELPPRIVSEMQSAFQQLKVDIQDVFTSITKQSTITDEKITSVVNALSELEQRFNALMNLVASLKPFTPPDKPETISTPPDEAIKPGA